MNDPNVTNPSWVEDKFHNSLEGVTVVGTKSQAAKPSWLTRVGNGLSNVFSKVKLPPVTVVHDIGKVEPGTKTMTYVIAGLIGLILLKKRK